MTLPLLRTTGLPLLAASGLLAVGAVVAAPVATSHYVATNGSDTTGDGTEANPWRTPERGMAEAGPGETVYARGGSYDPFQIPVSGTDGFPVSFKPYPGETVIISGDIGGTGTYGYGPLGKGGIEIDGQSFVTIDGTLGTLIIEKIGDPGGGGGCAVWAQGKVGGSQAITVRGVTTRHTENAGILAAGMEFGLGSVDPDEYRLFDVLIEYCDISDTNNSLHEAWDAGDQGSGNECVSIGNGVDGFIVRFNTIHESKQYGVDAKLGAINGEIYGNTIWSLRKHGIYIDCNTRRCQNISIYDNDISGCNTNGIALVREASSAANRAPRVPNLHDIFIFNNKIRGCRRGIVAIIHNNELTDPLGDDPGEELGLFDNIQIYANTIWGNDNPIEGDTQHFGVWIDRIDHVATRFLIASNIIWDNPDGAIDSDLSAGQQTTSANITVDPLFVNEATFDVHLQAGSPAIGAGDPAYSPLTDFDGVLRANPPSAGAYEFVSSGVGAAPNWTVQPSFDQPNFVIGDTIIITPGETDDPTATLSVETFTLGGVDKSGEVVGLDWDTTGESAGTISLVMRATNANGFALSQPITAELEAASLLASAGIVILHHDGAENDRDDIAAIPVAALLIRAAGLQAKTYLFGANNTDEASTPSQLADLKDSIAFAATLGITTYVYDDGITATRNALDALLTSGQSVVILEGGPMAETYRAFGRISAADRARITLVSHSTWNDNRIAGLTWTTLQRDFPEPTYIHIADQNGPGSNYDHQGFKNVDWVWMDGHSDPTIQAARAVMIPAGTLTRNDASDAGLPYYGLKGVQNGTALNAKTYIEAHLPFSALDIRSPVLQSTSPAAGATGVAIAANITLTYDENLVAGTGSFTLRNLTDGVDVETIPVGSATISGMQITLNPSADLGNLKEYQITAPAGILTDAGGNATVAIAAGDLTFTTVAAGAQSPFTTHTAALSGAGATSGTLQLGAHVAGSRIFVITCGGGAGLTTVDLQVTGATVELLAGLWNTGQNRPAELWEITGITASSAAYSVAVQDVMIDVFRTYGYTPAATPFVGARQDANNTLSSTVSATVPANGVALIQAKKYETLSQAPAGTVIDADTGTGASGHVSAHWVNATGAASTDNYTATTGTATNAKHTTVAILDAVPATDTTAPTLSSPLDAADGTSGYTGSVSTDEDNGTLYRVVTTSATAPTQAQVKSGLDHTGATAPASGSQTVSATGVQDVSGSGLSASTAYWIHYMHEDAAGNQSDVASGDGFTTAAPEQATDFTFGASTLSGAGGVAKPAGATSITGGTATGYTITSGFVVPSSNGSATAGTIVFNNGTTWTVGVESGAYSCRTQAQLLAAYAAMPLTGGVIRMRAGVDISGSGRFTLSARLFSSNECVITSDGFDIDADPDQMGTLNADGWSDPRSVTRSAKIGGPKFASGCQNVRLTGLDIYHDASLPGDDPNEGAVVWLVAPTTNISVVQNEIHSRGLEETFLAGLARYNASGDPAFQQHWAFFADPNHPANIVSGLFCKYTDDASTDVHTRFRANHNYVHDVSAGIAVRDCVQDGSGNRSEANRNYILDSMNNFINTGRKCDGVDIFDNWCMHVWTAEWDTNTADLPHSSTGVSWSPTPTGTPRTKNVKVMGNFLHLGWHRTKLHRDNGLADPPQSQTGSKINDPKASDNYQDIHYGFNLIVTHIGAGIEFTGTLNCTSFHNTIMVDKYTSTENGISHYFQGAVNHKSWNNIQNVMATGSNDGAIEDGVFLPPTLDTFTGYGNINVDRGSMDGFFVGHPTKGLFGELTLEEAVAAFVPKSTTWAQVGPQKHGALGTGRYFGLGEHDSPYEPPVPSGGTARSVPTTTWPGTVYATKAGSLQHLGAAMSDPQSITMLWEGQVDATKNGVTCALFGTSSNRIRFNKWPGNDISCKIIDSFATELMSVGTNIHEFTSADGFLRVACAISGGYMHGAIAVNGELLTTWSNDQRDVYEGLIDITVGALRINAEGDGSDIFKGTFRGFLLMNEYVDLESDAGMSSVFTSTGAFRSWGTTGSLVTPSGNPAAICFWGDAATLNAGNGNQGDGGAFTLSGGTVT